MEVFLFCISPGLSKFGKFQPKGIFHCLWQWAQRKSTWCLFKGPQVPLNCSSDLFFKRCSALMLEISLLVLLIRINFICIRWQALERSNFSAGASNGVWAVGSGARSALGSQREEQHSRCPPWPLFLHLLSGYNYFLHNRDASNNITTAHNIRVSWALNSQRVLWGGGCGKTIWDGCQKIVTYIGINLSKPQFPIYKMSIKNTSQKSNVKVSWYHHWLWNCDTKHRNKAHEEIHNSAWRTGQDFTNRLDSWSPDMQ